MGSMSETEWPSREKVIDAVHSRFFFQDRLATGGIITIIMLWYLFQIATLFLGWEKGLIQWVFTTEAFPNLSPGLFLAIISHAFPPQVTHLFGNSALLWLFAGESEQHMSRLEVGGFFVVTAQAAVLVGTAVSGESTMGASGGGLAFIGFYCVHMVLEHRDEFEFDTLGSKGLTSTSPRAYWGAILILMLILLLC